jgi:hypothetical protein
MGQELAQEPRCQTTLKKREDRREKLSWYTVFWYDHEAPGSRGFGLLDGALSKRQSDVLQGGNYYLGGCGILEWD